MKELFTKERNKAKEYLHLVTEVSMKGSSITISSMVKEPSSGLMGKSTKANGYRTKCLVKES